MVHKTSIEKSILLVDLAGSERADKVSGITKEQLSSIYQKEVLDQGELSPQPSLALLRVY